MLFSFPTTSSQFGLADAVTDSPSPFAPKPPSPRDSAKPKPAARRAPINLHYFSVL
jgi:hypothetical protein